MSKIEDAYGSLADKLEAYAQEKRDAQNMLQTERPTLFSSRAEEVLATLRKPNSIGEWNDLMASIICQSASNENSQPGGDSQGSQVHTDLETLMKLRNRRLRSHGGGLLKNWVTGHTELYIKCDEYLLDPSCQESKELAQKIIQLIGQIDYNETELARIQSLDVLKKEDNSRRALNLNQKRKKLGDLKKAKEKLQRKTAELIKLEKYFRQFLNDKNNKFTVNQVLLDDTQREMDEPDFSEIQEGVSQQTPMMQHSQLPPQMLIADSYENPGYPDQQLQQQMGYGYQLPMNQGLAYPDDYPEQADQQEYFDEGLPPHGDDTYGVPLQAVDHQNQYHGQVYQGPFYPEQQADQDYYDNCEQSPTTLNEDLSDVRAPPDHRQYHAAIDSSAQSKKDYHQHHQPPQFQEDEILFEASELQGMDYHQGSVPGGMPPNEAADANSMQVRQEVQYNEEVNNYGSVVDEVDDGYQSAKEISDPSYGRLTDPEEQVVSMVRFTDPDEQDQMENIEEMADDTASENDYMTEEEQQRAMQMFNQSQQQQRH